LAEKLTLRLIGMFNPLKISSRAFEQAAWLLLISLACLAVYYAALGGPFLLDDFSSIVDNSAIHIRELSLQSVWHAAISSDTGLLRRPVAMATFALNYYYNGLTPFYYKLVNSGLHIATALVLFCMTETLLGCPALSGQPVMRRVSNRQVAALITLLWALHPLHVSTVLYTVQRMTELSAFFTASGILLYLRGRAQMMDTRHPVRLLAIALGVVVCGTLATLSKENGALLPALLLVIEVVFYRDTWAAHPAARWIVGLLAIPTLAILAYLVSVWLGPFNHVRQFSPTERLLTEARVVVAYVGQILLPRIGQMSLLDENTEISRGLLSPPSTAWAIMALGGVIAASSWAAYKKKAAVWVFGVWWFLVGHLLESTVISLEIRFEHRNYLPSYGLLFAVGYTLCRWPLLETIRRRLHVACLAGVILALALQLHSRVETWATPQKFFDHELKNNPNSSRAWSDLAFFLLLEGKQEESIPILLKAATLNPREIGQLITVIDIHLYELKTEPDQKLVRELLTRLDRYPMTPYGQTCLIQFAENAMLNADRASTLDTAIPILRAAAKKTWRITRHQQLMGKVLRILEAKRAVTHALDKGL